MNIDERTKRIKNIVKGVGEWKEAEPVLRERLVEETASVTHSVTPEPQVLFHDESTSKVTSRPNLKKDEGQWD